MLKILKFVMLGSALVAPINAIAMIDMGKYKIAIIWCIVASVEVLIAAVCSFDFANRKV